MNKRSTTVLYSSNIINNVLNARMECAVYSVYSCVPLIAVWGQCEVKCDKVEGYSTSSFERYGLMPDGTPCVDADYQTTDWEMNYLTRRSGRQARCIQGYCQVRYSLYQALLLDVYSSVMSLCIGILNDK